MKNKKNILVLVLIGLGILTLFLPLYEKYQISKQNNIEIRAFERNETENVINEEDVEKYNEEANEKFNTSAENSYVKVVDTSQVIALAYIPKIDQLLPIRYGTDNTTLNNGLGILENTHMPTGGLGKNCVITGHRGTATDDLLKHIDRMEVGDVVYIRLPTRILKYKATNGQIVEPNDRSLITLEEDKDKLTIVTCHPYLINNKRLIFEFERDYLTDADNILLKAFKDADELFKDSIDMDSERIKLEKKEFTETELEKPVLENQKIIEDTGIMAFVKEYTNYIYLGVFLLIVIIVLIIKRVMKR